MIVMTVTNRRPTPSIPFFDQYILTRTLWMVKDFFVKHRPKIKLYAPRYSTDLLRKVQITTFSTKELYDLYASDEKVMLRSKQANDHDAANGIETIVEIQSMDDMQWEDHKSIILGKTWSRKCVILNSVPGFGADRLRSWAKKPDPDVLDYDQGYLSF